MFNKIIEEICQELDIKYTYLSKDWIIKLEKDNKVKYLSGNKFDLNGHAIGLIMDDKYAFYDTLNKLNIPACVHSIIYRENNNYEYANNCHTKEDIINYFNEYKENVVIKPNIGSLGLGVHHITNKDELLEKTKELLTENFSISICPFYNIKYEYRIIVLNNHIKLIYKKQNPVVFGDGKSTLEELLINFNKNYFEKKNIPNIVLKKNEKYTYDWHFNLSRGSIASLDIDNNKKEELSKLALEVSKKVGITFASIDIVELYNNKLLVLEANSGVTIDKVINFIPNGYKIAKDIYKEAIEFSFKNNI